MFLPALVSESMGVKGGKILLLRVGIGGNGEVAFARFLLSQIRKCKQQYVWFYRLRSVSHS